VVEVEDRPILSAEYRLILLAKTDPPCSTVCAIAELLVAHVHEGTSISLHVTVTYLSMLKTYQFKTQCKGDIRHAFETAKITLFDPVVCKTPDAPLQNELLG